ncbi:MAG: hypothetical protein ACRDN6_07890 [Gaiellaceae bacterium]
MEIQRAYLASAPSRYLGMCIRCRRNDAPQPLDFCVACSVTSRIEFASGLRRLEEYLRSHADFASWEERRARAHGT